MNILDWNWICARKLIITSHRVAIYNRFTRILAALPTWWVEWIDCVVEISRPCNCNRLVLRPTYTADILCNTSVNKIAIEQFSV